MQGFSHNSLRIEPFLRFVEAALLALEEAAIPLLH